MGLGFNQGAKSDPNADMPRIIAVVSLPFLIIGLAFGVFTCRLVVQSILIRSWPIVPATVLEAELQVLEDSEGRYQQTSVRYSYAVGKRHFVGTRLGLEDTNDIIGDYNKRWYRRLEAERAAGTTVPCYVNPKDPADSFLDRRLRADVLIGQILFSCMFSGVPLVAIRRAMRLAPPGSTGRLGEVPTVPPEQLAPSGPEDLEVTPDGSGLVFRWRAAQSKLVSQLLEFAGLLLFLYFFVLKGRSLHLDLSGAPLVWVLAAGIAILVCYRAARAFLNFVVVRVDRQRIRVTEEPLPARVPITVRASAINMLYVVEQGTKDNDGWPTKTYHLTAEMRDRTEERLVTCSKPIADHLQQEIARFLSIPVGGRFPAPTSR
jgi:hypothetical protein